MTQAINPSTLHYELENTANNFATQLRTLAELSELISQSKLEDYSKLSLLFGIRDALADEFETTGKKLFYIDNFFFTHKED